MVIVLYILYMKQCAWLCSLLEQRYHTSALLWSHWNSQKTQQNLTNAACKIANPTCVAGTIIKKVHSVHSLYQGK